MFGDKKTVIQESNAVWENSTARQSLQSDFLNLKSSESPLSPPLSP